MANFNYPSASVSGIDTPKRQNIFSTFVPLTKHRSRREVFEMPPQHAKPWPKVAILTTDTLKMIDILIQHINSKIDNKLTENDISLLSEVFRPKKIRKHQYFIQCGEVCKLAGFVVKGALKKFTIDDSGKEQILELFIENWWAADKESFMIGTPTPYFIDAYEDTELLVITKDDFFNKLSKLSFYSEFNRVLTERQSFQLMKRLHTSKTLTAEQKLEGLQNTYPEFFQRFPQHIIASYLGMTKETLSRIRSNALKK